MFKHYIKIAVRHLQKNKAYAAINMGGLAIGLTGFILLLLYVNYERSYDQWDSSLENIYQVNQIESNGASRQQASWTAMCDTRIAALLSNNLPGIESVTVVNSAFHHPFSVVAGNQSFLEDLALFRDADSAFFDVFPYSFIAGNPEQALDKRHSMVITDSAALKWFGTTNALGRSVKIKLWRDDPGTLYRITGIIKKTTAPSSLPIRGIFTSGRLNTAATDPQTTYSANIYARMQAHWPDSTLARRVDKIYASAFAALLQQRHTTLEKYTQSGQQFGIRLMPFQKVHLHPLNRKSVLSRLVPVIALSVLLLVIAIINFANLSTAQAIERAKETSVCTVIGATKRSPVLQSMLETSLQSLIALCAALFLAALLLPSFNHLFHTAISAGFLYHSIQTIWWQLIAILLITIGLSGIYPAFFLSAIEPIKALKGNYSQHPKGIQVRNILLVLQFLITTGFIIGIGITQKQINYMVHAELGFQPSGLINLNTVYDKKLAARLARIPGVSGVGMTNQVMGGAYANMQNVTHKGENLNLNIVTVSTGTLQTMGVQLLAGRLFSARYGQDTVSSIIVNESAAKLLGGEAIGKTIFENGNLKKQVVGVIADYHYEGFDQKVVPTLYSPIDAPGPMSITNNLLVRIDSRQFASALSGIKKVWHELYADFPLHYTFLDETFHQLIAEDMRFKKIISAFTLLSLLLSLIGIFALSAYMTMKRAKEISIRRVLGASVTDVLKMLNKNFIVLVIMANALAYPVAYILAQQWLNGFAYRIHLSVWPFVLATIISILLTILTVSLQAWRAVRANPADALKYE